MRKLLIAMTLLLLLGGCGPSSQLVQKASSVKIDRSINTDYFIKRLPKNYHAWIKAYNEISNGVPDCVQENQMGISVNDEGVLTYISRPHAYPTIYLKGEETLMSNKDLIGEYKLIYREVIEYTDSVSFKNQTVSQRDSVLAKDEDDVLVEISGDKYKLWVFDRLKGYSRKINNGYKYLKNKYLLIEQTFDSSCKSTATNFVVKTKDGHLIIDNYGIERRHKSKDYLVAQLTAIRMVLQKL
jgi:hypothetical protein